MTEITTIQVPKSLKKKLDALKEKPTDSYTDVLAQLVKEAQKRKIIMSMREYARKYGEESRREVSEWVDDPWD